MKAKYIYPITLLVENKNVSILNKNALTLKVS